MLSETSITVLENTDTDTSWTTASWPVVLSELPSHTFWVTVTTGDNTAAKLHTGANSPADAVTLTFTAFNWT